MHTRLDLSFDWDSAFVIGEANIDLQAAIVPSKKATLDARGFEISKVRCGVPDSLNDCDYTYDEKQLTVELPREFTTEEKFRINVHYIAKPNQLDGKGGIAIRSSKGLYYIDPDDAKNRQLWTQGEPEANSGWFPTIEATNQRQSQEIYLTVDTGLTTLSNGLLQFKADNNDGTRTDYWRMDEGHAPYLTMIAVGKFHVEQDKWRDMEVNYYVDPEYADHAKAIFGNTPEMLEFYSTKLGVDYPWSKYSQIAVREFVSGAMENTTAVVHGDFVQRTRKELLDRDYEDYIAHELFHHWFGDYVTCESWANLPLNESFATYGEYLWMEHKYGREQADYHLNGDLEIYLREADRSPKKMIRYDYKRIDQMFDAHSYQKGGRILHMLRAELGDDLFFKALKTYLETFKFSSAEMHDFRQVCEKVSGRDLTWFFDQWFFHAGHPELAVDINYIDSNTTVRLEVVQEQNLENSTLFRLPLEIDIYADGQVKKEKVIVNKHRETFKFKVNSKPDHVKFDAQNILLGEVRRTIEANELMFQYENAPMFMDRYEAVNDLLPLEDSATANFLTNALDDPAHQIRSRVVGRLKYDLLKDKLAVKDQLIALSQNDEKSNVRSAALRALSRNFDDKALIGQFESGLLDSSYRVNSAALMAIVDIDKKRGLKLAENYENSESESLLSTVASLYSKHGDASHNEFFAKASKEIKGAQLFVLVNDYCNYLERQNDATVTKGIDVLSAMVEENHPWWVRLIVLRKMTEIDERYDEQKVKAETRLEIMKKDNPNRPVYEEMLSSAQKVKTHLHEQFDYLRETVKDERVLSGLKKSKGPKFQPFE